MIGDTYKNDIRPAIELVLREVCLELGWNIGHAFIVNPEDPEEQNPLPPGRNETIRGYRGGYLPHRRREIEKGLRDGTVRGRLPKVAPSSQWPRSW